MSSPPPVAAVTRREASGRPVRGAVAGIRAECVRRRTPGPGWSLGCPVAPPWRSLIGGAAGYAGTARTRSLAHGSRGRWPGPLRPRQGWRPVGPSCDTSTAPSARRSLPARFGQPEADVQLPLDAHRGSSSPWSLPGPIVSAPTDTPIPRPRAHGQGALRLLPPHRRGQGSGPRSRGLHLWSPTGPWKGHPLVPSRRPCPDVGRSPVCAGRSG